MLFIKDLEKTQSKYGDRQLFVEIDGEVLELCGVQPTEKGFILHPEHKLR